MKLYNYITKFCACMMVSSLFFACTDDLNQSPLSTIPPEIYFESESQLESYVNNLYAPRNKWNNGNDQEFDVHGNWSFGTFGLDNGTDNMNNKTSANHFIPGEWRVDQNDGEWGFSFIYKCNYFLKFAQEKLDAGRITGTRVNIDQSFGEVYFFRAFEYFKKLQRVGDFPIVTEPLANEMEPLIEASKRQPRTEVAKFILADLDKAISLLKDDADGGRKNRISKYAAYMLKSRVALYEGTWMKYFKGTAFVPGGTGWPGASKDYNSGYAIANYDAVMNDFFQQCIDASKIVADKYPLVTNNGVLQQSITDAENPYHNMFGSTDLRGYSEVILWKQYDRGLGITHNVPIAAQTGGYVNGLTRGFVENFLLDNGKPIYADPARYGGDDYIADVRKNRDGRLWLFLKEPKQKNLLFNTEGAGRANPIEDYPNITSSNAEVGYGTGYAIRKGGTFDGTQFTDNGGCYTGSIIFRSAEACLNYMEAYYEKNNSLDGVATQYWKNLRDRAKVNNDFNITIAATDMNKEALNDWGAYSGGQLISPTLYNIRRERRSELMAEGLRMADLRRWRSLDQLISRPYHLEGMKLWGPMRAWYVDDKGVSILKYGVVDANVSGPDQSIYMRPQEINPNSLVLKQGGCKWAMAHYLYPIAIQHFLITSSGSAENSPIYQNPYWPMVANEGAIQ
ncbi:RagB/SusD family nutrient uptake outer membrane protein [Dysgonomonas sp. HGC4]|uniref:RagB/SusD family nutrient uptake outer membrane protein n=1 Tax=Dysgonomonas sp. HGC4 TaxID=1658009 RepID=UPI0006811A52|nr:RagB/SusD family nutrient uptake outer membrane protein [Dysgonomonas sp. HGC4]MBD8349224.1 RagB/SusD family nutrient uptake outer membrane protein [Dysgonomonas sp. HGC4]